MPKYTKADGAFTAAIVKSIVGVFRHIEHKTSIASQLIDNYNEYNR